MSKKLRVEQGEMPTFNSLEEKRMEEWCKERGIPFEDTTEQYAGQTAIHLSIQSRPTDEVNDSGTATSKPLKLPGRPLTEADLVDHPSFAIGEKRLVPLSVDESPEQKLEELFSRTPIAAATQEDTRVRGEEIDDR